MIELVLRFIYFVVLELETVSDVAIGTFDGILAFLTGLRGGRRGEA